MKFDFMITGEGTMASGLKVSRLQKRGQVTIPIEIRHKLGLEEGDMVAFLETEEGVVISPQEMVPADTLEKMESYFQERGVPLERLFGFAQRLKRGEMDEEAVTASDAGVAQQTAGIFRRRDRQGPEDFEALRTQFIEGTVEEVMAENAEEE
jgi:AbrB family looped-hinge helix DNA binding protein